MAERKSNIENIRINIEESISKFYSGFSASLYSSEDFGDPASVETYISSLYEKNASSLVSRLKNSIKDLDSIRSKYVPWEIVRDVGSYNEGFDKKSSFSSKDNKFFYESYENAFMRAMGMPESDDILLSQKDYAFIPGNLSAEGEYVVTKNPVNLISILSERETVDIRSAKISEDFYDVSSIFKKDDLLSSLTLEEISALGGVLEKYIELYSEEEQRVLEEGVRNFELENKLTFEFIEDVKELGVKATDQSIKSYFENEVLKKPSSTTLVNIFEDFLSTSYLLVPPVQNSSISKCISNPKSIVKKPFEIEGPKLINLSEARESLLETIINIRLDKVAGLNFEKVRGVLLERSVIKAAGNEDPNNLNDLTQDEEEITFEDFTGENSIIENIISNRLFKALRVSCIEVAKEIRALIEDAAEKGASESVKSKNKFGEGAPKTPGDQPNLKHVKYDFKDSLIKNRNIESYESLKSINDSVLFILSQKENLTSFSDPNTKYSSLRSGALFAAISESVTFPGTYIDSKIKEINDSLKREEKSKEGLKGRSKKIDELLGVYRGVGVLDVLVFGLAMFLVGEDVLIGLLSLKGYENLKRIKGASSKDFFDAFESSKGIVLGGNSNWRSYQAESLLAFSEKIIELYRYIKYKEFSK